jgi:hypothetical protein
VGAYDSAVVHWQGLHLLPAHPDTPSYAIAVVYCQLLPTSCHEDVHLLATCPQQQLLLLVAGAGFTCAIFGRPMLLCFDELISHTPMQYADIRLA